jgi:hypothetical protein
LNRRCTLLVVLVDDAARGTRTGTTDSALVRLKSLLDIARSGADALLPLVRNYQRALTKGEQLASLEEQNEVVSGLALKALQTARAVPGLRSAISAGLAGTPSSFAQMNSEPSEGPS